MRHEIAVYSIALSITIMMTYVSYSYIEYKNLAEGARDPNPVWDIIESFELRFSDVKFKVRGESSSTANVALIAIDDDSLREVGRWPWGRDNMSLMAANLNKWGTSSIGYDVIFSEAERAAPQSDELFGQTISEMSDKIVLGTLNEAQVQFRSYQDFCLNEAFLAAGGDQIIKLNPTMAVDDPEDEYDTLKWNQLFPTLFSNYTSELEKNYLKTLSKADTSTLTSFQQNSLKGLKTRGLYEYCQIWLTMHDPYPPQDFPALAKVYKEIFEGHSTLKGRDLPGMISEFKNSIPFNLVPQYIDWVPNIPQLQTNALYTASFNTTLDSDGYVRRYALFNRTGNKLGTSYIPTLALQTYLIAKKYRTEISFSRKNHTKAVNNLKIYDTQTEPETLVAIIPVDFLGRIPINYYGPRMALPYVSAKDMLTDDPTMLVRQRIQDPVTGEFHLAGEGKIVNKIDFFKDRAVIVGATAMALYDLRNTPLEKNYPGPETHLTVLANLMEGKLLKNLRNEQALLPVLTLVGGTFFSLAICFLSPLWGLVVFLFGMSVALGADFYVFIEKGILGSNFLILNEFILIYLTVTVYKYFTEEKAKRELRSTFSKYVSPAIVDEVLKDTANLKLGGRKQRMSVMFSDVRGFTTISEKLPPTELAQLLNDYLSPMTDIVFKNKGTLDKYMGDAIMAFFGAPVFYKDHAAHACRCALESLVKLKELQAQFKAKDLPMIDIGIGINTGEMSVGNMGSKIVQSYTVMGDSVNLGSRLEGINKEYGTRIIISEFTYNDVKDQFACREVDRVKVKGKNEPVRIFEVLQEGVLNDKDKPWVEQYEIAFKLYYEKQFAEAIKHFEKTKELRGEDPLSDVYLERCEDYLKDPPPADWDGVYTMKTK